MSLNLVQGRDSFSINLKRDFNVVLNVPFTDKSNGCNIADECGGNNKNIILYLFHSSSASM